MTSSWVAIDFETANSFRGSPCSVGMVEVEDGRILGSWSTRIRPPARYSHFDDYNIAIHGIDPQDVANAPGWAEALDQITGFADGRPFVAHNAGFDFGVVRSACTAEDMPWPELRFACSQVAARRTWRLLSYRLPLCAHAAGFELHGHHDALSDADASARVMLAAMAQAGVTTLADLLDNLHIGWGRLSARGTWQGSRHKGSPAGTPVPSANADADPGGALFGLAVCVTGRLASMTRDEAHSRLAVAGAQPVPDVNKNTDILISASQTNLLPGSTMSGKEAKAQRLLAAGHDIEVINEVELLQRLQS
jgi:DNA polymerase III epsilon subunit-like protein